MPALFTPADRANISALNVVDAQFVRLDLPSGELRLHSGAGDLTFDGEEWRGISDPVTGLIGIAQVVREPQIGQASAASLVLSGAGLDFMKSMRNTAREIEGRRCDIYYGVVDGETLQQIGSLMPILVGGYMSAPSLLAEGISVRTVAVTIESIYSSKNFALGATWNGPGQRRRFAGDYGLDFIGVKIEEQIK